MQMVEIRPSLPPSLRKVATSSAIAAYSWWLTPRRPYAEQLAPHFGCFDDSNIVSPSKVKGFFEICWTHHVLMS